MEPEGISGEEGGNCIKSDRSQFNEELLGSGVYFGEGGGLSLLASVPLGWVC